MSTRVNDRIETLVHFKKGHLIPLRFLWKNHSYKIDSLTTSYQTRDGGVEHLHFAALCQGNFYELVFTPTDNSWFLTNIHTQ